MTTNGRGSKGGRRSSEPPESARAPSQAPSGVFRTASEQEQSIGQRRWGDRWIVAEQFIREGFYYRLLKRPVGAGSGPLRLTQREDDVLRLASAGHSNKSIAQRLNVSASTVGVLLFRAASKLGVASRSDLLKAYAAHDASKGASKPAAVAPTRGAPAKRKH